MKLSVLIPVYNEERTLRTIVEKVIKQNIEGITEKKIILIDDASTDRSWSIIEELKIQYPEVLDTFRKQRNEGKGAAIRTAIEKADGDIALIQDADLEYDPGDYPTLLEPIINGKADVVYGSRFLTRGTRRVLFFKHALGNKLITFISNLCTDLYLTDIETCYKAFRLVLLKTIPIRSNRFGLEPEITAKIAKRKLRIFEVPIHYSARNYREGKKITWKDGVSALWIILKYLFINDAYLENHGERILSELREAPKFNEWSLDLIKPFISSEVLEVGSGIGNNIIHFMTFCGVIATDYNEEYLIKLKDRYENIPNVRVYKWNIEKPPEGVIPRVETVFCSNVLEHIKDENLALHNIRSVLKDGGKLILIVPYGEHLFCKIDRIVDHQRRYSLNYLKNLVENANFEVEHIFTFNKIGMLGWLVRGVLMRAKTLGRSNLKVFNTIIPIIRFIDPFLPWAGLSIILVAKKNQSTIQNSK